MGIPSAVIITEPFVPTAETIAEIDGMPDYSYVTIPHPVTSLSVEQLVERAREAAAQVERILLGAGGERADGAGVGVGVSVEETEAALQPYRSGLQADGADLRIDRAEGAAVELALVFSDATCIDCIMPSATVRKVLASVLSGHYGRAISVTLDDPRDTAAVDGQPT